MSDIKLYTTEDIVRILGVTRRTLYRYIEAGQIKVIKVGRTYRITEENLMEFLEKGTDKNYMQKLKKAKEKKKERE